MENEVKDVTEIGGEVESIIETITAILPKYFSREQQNALASKYIIKWKKAPAEVSQHKAAFKNDALNNCALYILTEMSSQADAKILSDKRDANIQNVLTAINSYTHAETLTERQVAKNKRTDEELHEIADEIGDNHGERVTILKAVRKTWSGSFDNERRQSMDAKIKRACHQFAVDYRELEN